MVNQLRHLRFGPDLAQQGCRVRLKLLRNESALDLSFLVPGSAGVDVFLLHFVDLILGFCVSVSLYPFLLSALFHFLFLCVFIFNIGLLFSSSSGLGGDGDRSGESETTIDCLVGDADR